MTAEHDRLQKDAPAWRQWGPYLSERAWGTVREDYSDDGSAWAYLPHDHARSRAYRWNEDGLAGICDSGQRLCFALAMWNERDPILKERLFGVSGPEGNHGEDVKEYYFYLDSTPTHSYMKMLYKYPHAEFPYADLVRTNAGRSRHEPEYELADTGVFADDSYFDVVVEYAKRGPSSILARISVKNHGLSSAPIHLLPTLWIRNTWSWGMYTVRPALYADPVEKNAIRAEAAGVGRYSLYCEGTPDLLFTDNETNLERLYGVPNPTPYRKDGINSAVVGGQQSTVNPEQRGTKAAAHYTLTLAPHETATIRLVLEQSVEGRPAAAVFSDFDDVFRQRQEEANDFYNHLQPTSLTADERLVQRQAFAGMLWSKQFYNYDVSQWLEGDPNAPPPHPSRKGGRNSGWPHLNTSDVISMPDKWEYPWFAAWDLAFHCLPLAMLDPGFAKDQLLLLGREWYQHPNGQIPAYEWAFGDVNPPVLAWAAWRVYSIEQEMTGSGDTQFLEKIFHKLLLNFTWWVNRKDSEGMNVFQGGFLGLDNIGVFDRSAPLPTGGHIEQSDGTSWMGMFCLNMLTIALELACRNRVYEDIATKFFEHFLYIADALNNLGGAGIELWDSEDEFFYDVLHVPDGTHIPLKVRSMVGLIPLYAVTTIEHWQLDKLPEFAARMKWFLRRRPDLAAHVSRWQEPGMGSRRLVALLRGHRMKRLLARVLDEAEFLSPFGVRALSRYHADHPYRFYASGQEYTVEYQPAESNSGLFGGNSNWRGPVWFPVNFLIIEALQRFHHYYGDNFRIECPTGSGRIVSILDTADELSQRLIRIFVRDEQGRRPVFGERSHFNNDPAWRDYIPFFEYFHGDDGSGVGASHQTGWTGLVAVLIQQQGERRLAPGSSDAQAPEQAQ